MKIGDKVKFHGGKDDPNNPRKFADKLEVAEIYEHGARVKAQHYCEKLKRVTEIYVGPASCFEKRKD